MTPVRAAVYTGADRPLEIESLELAPPGPGEVAVRIDASGLCHSDLHVMMGEWSERPPMVLGHEGCGVVEAVGEGVHRFAPGDRVVLCWYAPCGECARCRSGRPWICTETRANDSVMPDGTTRLRRSDGEPVRSYLTVGSLGSAAVVPESGAIRVDSSLPAEVGALIGCGVATGVGAVLNTAAVQAGQSVVVIGCGGVGLSAVMGAALAGAGTIIAVDLHDEKLDLARDVGATHGVRGGDTAGSEIARILPDGPDHVFEAIGLQATIEWAFSLMPMGGTTTLVGMTPEGVRVGFDPLSFTAAGQTILGCTYGSCVPDRDFPRFAALAMEGRLPVERLIAERIGLDDVNRAFDQMREGDGARRVLLH
jgi:S-(hydroxymethyl)glutathione dehydrogenase / alcohol dehydrogenase